MYNIVEQAVVMISNDFVNGDIFIEINLNKIIVIIILYILYNSLIWKCIKKSRPECVHGRPSTRNKLTKKMIRNIVKKKKYFFDVFTYFNVLFNVN